MLSRILWISVAGLALIIGIAVQDGDKILGWVEDTEMSATAEGTVEDRVDRAIDRSFDKMDVTGSDGREIDVPAETKRAMAAAVAQLVKAETDFAMARVGDASDEEIQSAQARRTAARAEVERLKDQIEKLDRASDSERQVLREQIKREIQQDVRATVRESVGG